MMGLLLPAKIQCIHFLCLQFGSFTCTGVGGTAGADGSAPASEQLGWQGSSGSRIASVAATDKGWALWADPAVAPWEIRWMVVLDNKNSRTQDAGK